MLFALISFAQAYGCDTYGSGSYGQCAIAPESNSSSVPGANSQTSTVPNNTAQTTQPAGSTSTQAPMTGTQQKPPATIQAEVGTMGYGTIFLVSLALAIGVAILVLLFKRLWRRRHQDQSV